MKKIFLIVLTLSLVPLKALAYPATGIEIEYVQSEGQLYVYMNHLSRDHRQQYIRKTTIFVNGEEVTSKSNRQQIDPTAYAFSIELKAKENDTITVKAYSAEGGVGEASMVVPKKGDGDEPISEVKAKVEAYQNKDESVDVYGSQEKATP